MPKALEVTRSPGAAWWRFHSLMNHLDMQRDWDDSIARLARNYARS